MAVGRHKMCNNSTCCPLCCVCRDLSNNKQLCGSAPVSRSNTMDVRAGGSGIGQPCGTKAVTTGGSPAGSAPADPENTGSSSLSSEYGMLHCASRCGLAVPAGLPSQQPANPLPSTPEAQFNTRMPNCVCITHKHAVLSSPLLQAVPGVQSVAPSQVWVCWQGQQQAPSFSCAGRSVGRRAWRTTTWHMRVTLLSWQRGRTM